MLTNWQVYQFCHTCKDQMKDRVSNYFACIYVSKYSICKQEKREYDRNKEKERN